MRAVLLRPLINEKSMMLIKGDMYTFEIAKEANKLDVKKEVTDRFKVDVLSVRTINIAGKVKTQASRKGFYKTKGMKKAIVKIKKGQKIAIFEVATPEEEVEIRTVEGEVVGKTKEKKSLLSGTKVKIERGGEAAPHVHPEGGKETGKPGKTKGENN